MATPRLREITDHFATLTEAERRDGLISLAEAAESCAPLAGERFDLEDVRKDHECSDTVGIHLRLDDGRVHLAVSLGCKVQTLTRALAVVLCRGLEGASLHEAGNLPDDFVEQIVGEKLVQLRARTIYYLLHRVREAARKLRDSPGGGPAIPG